MADITSRRLLRASIAAAALLAALAWVSPGFLQPGGATHAAAGYPRRPVRVVVPFPPGGGTDSTIRLLARQLGERLGQPVIVENRPGAGSAIGSQYVANQRPDGYTLLMATNSLLINKAVDASTTYDPVADFTPVILFANAPSVLVASPSAPFDDVREMLDYARSRPDHIKYASFGRGSTPHIAAVNLEAVSGTDLRHVPYAGGAPARTAVMRGESDILMSSIVPVASAIRSGALKGLGIAAAERSPLLPQTPTFREQGIDLVSGTWFGLMAPAGTPALVVERVYRESAELLTQDQELRRQMTASGLEVVALGAPEFAALMRDELVKLATLARLLE